MYGSTRDDDHSHIALLFADSVVLVVRSQGLGVTVLGTGCSGDT